MYIHWPFCASKCPYCDFNSHVATSVDHKGWAEDLCAELAYYARYTQGRQLTSIFFGGGTPSLMAPQTVEALIHAAGGFWSFAPDIEITLEANPTSVETNKFSAFRAAGVNRVSLGIQSLRDEDLAFLGRQHSATEALTALETARQVFDRTTFDLIYARPSQTPQQWQAELGEALGYADGHMSLYQLTIEPGTRFFTEHARGAFKIPAQDEAGELYELTQSMMEDAGLPSYEVSNHAALGQESRHNMAYWLYADYIGIGPGAHGRLTHEGGKYATRAHRAPDIWRKRVQDNGHGGHEWEFIKPEDRIIETLMMGLRTYEGVSFEKLDAEYDGDWRQVIAMSKLDALVEQGMLVVDEKGMRPTSAGIQRLNSLLGYLL